MDKNYYEILGISSDASADEIKRAYFKLVRKYSPEREPERFQEIREAYENLKAEAEKSETDENKFQLEFPDDRLARLMREATEEGLRQRDYKGAAKVAEEAIQRFGDSQGFMYLLGIAQQMAGKTGKAVKTFENLTKLYPDHRAFQRQLAFAYQDRGYSNKAYTAFYKAYDMGCRDMEFLHLFGRCCEGRGDNKKGISLMEELVEGIKKKNVPNEYTEEMLDALMGIFIMSVEYSKESLQKALLQFQEFFQTASVDLNEYEDEIEQVLFMMMCGVNKYGLYEEESIKKIRTELKLQAGKDQWKFEYMWNRAAIMAERMAVDSDIRLSPPIKLGFDAYSRLNDMDSDEIDSGYYRFIMLDAQLCMLEDWPENQKEFEIVRKCYPIYYEKLKDFIHRLETSKDLSMLRQRLQKDYERYQAYYGEGNYYRFHPEQKRKKVITKWDSDADGTYTRSQRKIGRNEPCPCGSGKKYKNCCGRG